MKLVFALFFSGFFALTAFYASARETLTVTNTNDEGPGSLRFVCMNASKGDSIVFAPELSGKTIILLTTIEPKVDLTINGSSLADTLTITTDLKVRAFNLGKLIFTFRRLKFERCQQAISGSNSTKVYNCTFIGNSQAMINGQAYNCTFIGNSANNGNGGALIFGKAYNCTFIGNSAKNGDGGAMILGSAYNCMFIGNSAVNGGALHLTPALNCTFIGNSAVGNSTKNGNAGAMQGATAYNCTFTANSATNSGGALFNTGANNCTITNNTAKTGGGLFSEGGMIFFNCIIAGNTVTQSGADVFGEISSWGGNVIGNADGSQGWGRNDIAGTLARPSDPMLGDTVRCANGQLHFRLKRGSLVLGFGRETPLQDTNLCKDICGNPRPASCIDAGSFQQSRCAHTKLLGGCAPTSRALFAQNESFSLYPNPTASRVRVQLSVPPVGLSAEVYDLTGRQLLSQPLTDPETEIRTENLPSGVYLLKIGDRTAKLIKE